MIWVSLFSFSHIQLSNAHALLEAHNLCQQVNDYVGCYNFHTNSKEKFLSYGPLRFYLSRLISREENIIVPALNEDNKLLFLAINCKSKYINVKSENGPWKKWLAPRSPFEFRIIYDFCKQNYNSN